MTHELNEAALREKLQTALDYWDESPCFLAGKGMADVIRAYLAAARREPAVSEEGTDTETFCAEVLGILGIEGRPTFALLNAVAAFAMRCENEGVQFERDAQRVQTLEFKTGIIADRRAAEPTLPEEPSEQ
jgi:hypothetical protein